MSDINAWMTNNKLKLNNDENKIMLFRSNSSLTDGNITSPEVDRSDVQVSDGPVSNLGVSLVSDLISD